MPLRKPPHSHNQLELFSALFTDVASRDTQDTLEFPFLSLSKKPRFKPIEYTSPKGLRVLVSGGEPYGIANIWDWDLIIWLLSQVRAGIEKKECVSRKIRFSARSFLIAARRAAGGSEYTRLEASLKRLKSTNVETTIRAKNGKSVIFSWIEYLELVRDQKGRLKEVIVVIPEWLFEAVSTNSLILSLHPGYFLLTGGLERWLYRLVRKQAGNNYKGWEWKMRTLHERSGTTQRFSDFARDLRRVLEKKELLDYRVENFRRNGEEWVRAVRAELREKQTVVLKVNKADPINFLNLKTSTYEEAKKIAPGHDVYM